MNFSLPLILTSILLFSLNANDEFPLIQPVSVENTPIVKAIEPSPLDDDGDGVLNKEDKCPNTKSGEAVDKLGCLIENDLDNDGVPDKDDECPDTAIGTSVDYKGCVLDSDGDGVIDLKDNCPDTNKDFVVDGYGCPQTATLKVNFEPGKSNVSDSLINQLETFALFLKQNKAYQVVIYGYTDSIGDEVENKKLSQQRANAVKEALKRYDISITRLTSIGKGEVDPIADNKTEEGRAINRRIEVELIH